MRNESVNDLAERLSEISPVAVIAVIKSIEKQVEKALSMAGLAKVPYFSLPFPAMQHRHRYAEELSTTLRELREMKIVTARPK